MQTKKCNKCNQEKSLSEFSKALNRKIGVQSKCKSCDKEYRQKNREKILKYLTDYNDKNRDELLSKRKKYRLENIEKVREQGRIWAINNPEKIKSSKQKLMIKNKEKYYAKTYERNSARRKTDSFYNLKCRLSHRVRLAMKGVGLKKSKRTIEMIGCAWEDLVKHLERQFTTGMSWDNRSEWHIDHIIPLATATCEDDIIRLNHFTNLRPLWAEDNLRKSNKLEHLI